MMDQPTRFVLHHGTEEAEILHGPEEYESDRVLELDRTWLHWLVLAMYKNRDIIADETKGHAEFMDFFDTRDAILKCCSALLGAGALIEAKDSSGRTPLHYACITKDLRLIELLLDEGYADIEARDKAGNTPLLQCIDTFQMEAFGFLLARGARINAQNNSGFSCLHFVCQALTLKAPVVFQRVDMLLGNGADFTLNDIHGRTPFDVVRACNADDPITQNIRKSLIVKFEELLQRKACEDDAM